MKKEFSEEKWNKAVTKCKELVSRAKDHQMVVAKEALSVCEITHGGLGSKELFTIKRFAEEINIRPKTLSSWIVTYRCVYKRLDKKKRDQLRYHDMFSIAKKVNLSSPREKVNKYADYLITDGDLLRKMGFYYKNMRSICFNFKKDYVIKDLYEKDREMLNGMVFFSRFIIERSESVIGKTKLGKNYIPNRIITNKLSVTKKFNIQPGETYRSLDGFGEVRLRDHDEKVYRLITSGRCKPMSPTQVSKKLGDSSRAGRLKCYRSLLKLMEIGIVRKEGNGLYAQAKRNKSIQNI